jgi:hypothetical protein
MAPQNETNPVSPDAAIQQVIQTAAIQAVDLAMGSVPDEVRKKAVEDTAKQVIEEIPGLATAPAPSLTPTEPVGTRLSPAAEKMMEDRNEPPLTVINLRDGIKDLPPDGQVLWLQEYYKAVDYAKTNPTDKGDSKEAAWAAVQMEFKPMEGGGSWIRRDAVMPAAMPTASAQSSVTFVILDSVFAAVIPGYTPPATLEEVPLTPEEQERGIQERRKEEHGKTKREIEERPDPTRPVSVEKGESGRQVDLPATDVPRTPRISAPEGYPPSEYARIMMLPPAEQEKAIKEIQEGKYEGQEQPIRRVGLPAFKPAEPVTKEVAEGIREKVKREEAGAPKLPAQWVVPLSQREAERISRLPLEERQKAIDEALGLSGLPEKDFERIIKMPGTTPQEMQKRTEEILKAMPPKERKLFEEKAGKGVTHYKGVPGRSEGVPFARPEMLITRKPDGQYVLNLPTESGAYREVSVGSKKEAEDILQEHYEKKGVPTAPKDWKWKPPKGQMAEGAPAAQAVTPKELDELLQRGKDIPLSKAPEDVTKVVTEIMRQVESAPAKETGESPAGRPRRFDISPENLTDVVKRLSELANKSPKTLTEEERQEAMGITEDLLASGYKLSKGNWDRIKNIDWKGGEGVREFLLKYLDDPATFKMRDEPAKPESYPFEKELERGVKVRVLTDIIADPNMGEREKTNSRDLLKKQLMENPQVFRTIEKEVMGNRQKEVAKKMWRDWVIEKVDFLYDALISGDEMAEDEARKEVSAMTNPQKQEWFRPTAAYIKTNNIWASFMKIAQEEKDMPRKGQIQLDAKAGVWQVLHANFLKPMVFASKEQAEQFVSNMGADGNPQVTKEGESFKVTHPDWENPVEAKAAEEAEQVVEQKLIELGDPEDQAKAEAKGIVAASIKKVAVDVSVDPSVGQGEVFDKVKKAVEGAGLTMEEAHKAIMAQPGGGQVMGASQDGQNVQADVKQTSPGAPNKPLVSGFPNTDVSAGSGGKHPPTKGVVVTESGDPGTIDKSKPGAASLRSDQAKKFDKEVNEVNRANGLVKKMEKLASTEKGTALLEAFLASDEVKEAEEAAPAEAPAEAPAAPAAAPAPEAGSEKKE